MFEPCALSHAVTTVSTGMYRHRRPIPVWVVCVTPESPNYNVAVSHVSARVPWHVVGAGKLEARLVRLAFEVQVQIESHANTRFFSQRPPALLQGIHLGMNARAVAPY